MALVVDTSVVIACVTNEPDRDLILSVTGEQALISAASLRWEMGNALSAMFKQRRIALSDAVEAIRLFSLMPIELRDVDLKAAVVLCNRFRIYAYDAYILQAAMDAKCQLITLDTGLKAVARSVGVSVLEMRP